MQYLVGTRHFTGEGNGNPLQYSCQENPMDRRAWQATGYRVAKSQTQWKQLTTASNSMSGSNGKESACNAGHLGLIPGSGRYPGEDHGNPLQYSCLENPMDGGAWWTTVYGVAKSRTQLSDFTFFLSGYIRVCVYI